MSEWYDMIWVRSANTESRRLLVAAAQLVRFWKCAILWSLLYYERRLIQFNFSCCFCSSPTGVWIPASATQSSCVHTTCTNANDKSFIFVPCVFGGNGFVALLQAYDDHARSVAIIFILNSAVANRSTMSSLISFRQIAKSNFAIISQIRTGVLRLADCRFVCTTAAQNLVRDWAFLWSLESRVWWPCFVPSMVHTRTHPLLIVFIVFICLLFVFIANTFLCFANGTNGRISKLCMLYGVNKRRTDGFCCFCFPVSGIIGTHTHTQMVSKKVIEYIFCFAMLCSRSSIASPISYRSVCVCMCLESWSQHHSHTLSFVSISFAYTSLPCT